ncbi:MAG TPA: GspH/FimT family pseudopilin [Rhodanobacteraceae bacterium]|nr:GspH/FimT family pseudopilin [Rhodanobacteraceae bacterium]
MRARQRGITLIEMMMTVAIASILVAMGVPALGSILARSHQQSAEGALQASLMHARELAITRSEQVVVCPTRDGRSCTSDDLWQGGWMIGVDIDHDRQPDTPLARFDAMPTTMRIVSSQGRPRVVFQPDGSAGGSNAQLTICHTGDVKEGRAVIVANSGRVRVAPADAAHLSTCLASAN